MKETKINMSRLATPGFSRLKAPGYSANRQPSAIVSSTNGSAVLQNPSGISTQPTGTAVPQARSALKKPPQPPENQQEQSKVVKPGIPGFSQQKGSKSTTKLAANQALQHGTGPYDRTTQPAGTIPYVGKKRPAGVLKAPDSRTSMTKPQMTNGTEKANDTIVVDPKAPKKKILPPKTSENGTFAVPKAINKRMSVPVSKYQGCSDLTKIESPRRQTISTPESARPNSKLGSVKNNVAIRPRSCVMPNKSAEIKKPDPKKSISKSLQNIPKSIPTIPLPSKGLNKKDFVRKSGSHDDLLSCTKKETAKKPVAGVIPRTKSGGLTSKFGFGKPAERPRPLSSNSMVSATVSTPHQSTAELKKFEDQKLSPITGIYKSALPNKLDEAFDIKSHVSTDPVNTIFNISQTKITNETDSVNSAAAEICEVMDIQNAINDSVSSQANADQSDTKTINIIINLDTVSSSQEFNTTATLSENDGVYSSATLNGNFDTDTSMNKTKNIDLDLSKTAIVNGNSHIHSTTQTLNETLDLNSKTFNGNLGDYSPIIQGNKYYDSPSILNETRNINLNSTHTLDDEHCKYLNSLHCLHEDPLNKTVNIDRCSDSDKLLNKTRTLFHERDILNQTHTIENANQTFVLENSVLADVNAAKVIRNDTLDKSDSGFDDTNVNLSDILPPPQYMSFEGALSEDVMKVIAAISSNINRPTNVATFACSPMKSDVDLIPQNNDYVCCVMKDELIDGNAEGVWLNENIGPDGPCLEDTAFMSQTSKEEDESNTLYQTDDLLSKSTSIDMSTITSNNTQWQENSHLIKFSGNNYESTDVQSSVNRTFTTEDDVFKDIIDGEDLSLCTDISQSTDQLRNCLSSIGTDTEDIDDIDNLTDINPNIPLLNHDGILDDNIFDNEKPNEIDDLNIPGLQSQNISSSLNNSRTLCNISGINTVDGIEISDIEIPTSIEYSDVNASITDKTSGIGLTNTATNENCSQSISKEIADAIIRDSGHSTDLNDNEINSALTASMNKLNINNVKKDLFSDEYTEQSSEICPSTPPTEFEKSMSSDVTYPSTPLSQQESLEHELARRCNTIDCTRKMKKVGRSRTYSSSELITKFRIPKELKCVETSEGDILMDKTTFLHFMNEVKLVKTSLLKLKRTLVEAQCTSPLVKSPLKRANSAVEASAIPPLSPRTCQCSPMAVVNPMNVLSTGSITTATKEKETVLSLEEQIAFLNEKLQDSTSSVKVLQSQLVDSASTIKLLQTQLENHEQKEQDIIEENILLREEISHLTERLRNSRVTEVVGEDGTPASFDEFDLAVDLDSRLSILQRLYSDG